MNRKHELFLIDLGLQTLLDRMVTKPKVKKVVKKNKGGRKKWTKEQHEKYAATMEKKWGKNRKKP